MARHTEVGGETEGVTWPNLAEVCPGARGLVRAWRQDHEVGGGEPAAAKGAASIEWPAQSSRGISEPLVTASIDLKTLGAGLATIALAGVGAGVEPPPILGVHSVHAHRMAK